jgi:hypothetical protein
MMTFCKITNLTNMQVVIEDIQLYIPPNGVAQISTDTGSRSSDLHRMNARSFIRVDTIYVRDAIPTRAPMQVSYDPVPTSPTVIVEKTQDVNSLQKDDLRFAEINGKMDEILRFLKNNSSQIEQVAEQVRTSQPVVVPYRPGMEHSHEITSNSGMEPIFIPSSIVPKEVEVSLSSKEQSLDKDLSQAQGSLAKLRRKKP